MNDSNLLNLYTQYKEATLTNYPNAYLFSFEEVKENVKANAEPDDDIEALTKSVLEAMLYTSSNSVPDMIERAEEDFKRRYLEMAPEQRAVCDNYRLKF